MTSTVPFRFLAAGASIALASVAFAQAPATPAAPTTPRVTPPAAVAPQAAPPAAAAPQAPSAATPAAPGTAAQERAKSRMPREASAPGAAGAPRAGTPRAGTVPGTAGTTAAAAQGAGTAQKGGAKDDARVARREYQKGRGLQNVYADLMTPEELAAHRSKVKQTKTYAECKALFEATGKEMEARAKAQNKSVTSTPTELCDRAKERGRLAG